MNLLNLFCSKKSTPIIRQPKPRSVKLNLEYLEDRIVPDGGLSYWWDPVANGDYKWDNTDNWDVGTLGSGTHPLDYPTSSDYVNFSGAIGGAKQPCIIDVNVFGNILLHDGYNQKITITQNAQLTMTSFNDYTPATDKFWVDTGTTTSQRAQLLVAAGNGGILDFHNAEFDGVGYFEVDGGNVFMGGHSTDTSGVLSNGVTLLVNGGTVDIGPIGSGNQGSEVDWKAPINVFGGNLNFMENPGSATLLYNGATALAYLTIQSPGTVNLVENSAATSSTITMPIDITTGTLNAFQGGTWYFQASFGTDMSRLGNIFNEHGTLNLGGGVTLNFANDANNNRLGGYRILGK